MAEPFTDRRTSTGATDVVVEGGDFASGVGQVALGKLHLAGDDIDFKQQVEVVAVASSHLFLWQRYLKRLRLLAWVALALLFVAIGGGLLALALWAAATVLAWVRLNSGNTQSVRFRARLWDGRLLIGRAHPALLLQLAWVLNWGLPLLGQLPTIDLEPPSPTPQSAPETD